MKRRMDGWTGGRIVIRLAVLLSAYPLFRPSALFAQCPDGSPPPCRAQPTRVAPPPNSVAVLYFDNLSRDTADAYVAEGLTEELIARLGQVHRLRVKSRAAVERHRGAGRDPAFLGRALGVAHLLNGSVRRSGTRLRVTVELVRAATGDRVWGDQYDRTDADLLVLQEDIARAVVAAIAGRLLPAERASLATRPTVDPAAYASFLRGHYYLAQRSRRAVARAIEEYEAAVRLDPGFTAALARIAYGYALFLDWDWDYPGLPAESVLARGLAASERALRQDSATSDAWMARGYLLSFRHPGTFEGAPEAFERAIRLDPQNAEGYHQYGWILSQLGTDSAAVATYGHALAREPDRAITLRDLAVQHMMRHRFDEALRWLDSTLVVYPAFYQAYSDRARLRLQLGDRARARADAETAVRLAPDGDPWGVTALGLVQLADGDSAGARARPEPFLRELDQGVRRPNAIDVYLTFALLVAVGEHDRALALLERFQPRGPRLWFFIQAPEFDALRRHPRFQRLVEESRPPGAPR
jgi:TolB-like protein/Flp pilus assembly protein TadD